MRFEILLDGKNRPEARPFFLHFYLTKPFISLVPALWIALRSKDEKMYAVIETGGQQFRYKRAIW
jgi:hypothetical protein